MSFALLILHFFTSLWSAPVANKEVGSKACATCHAAVYRRYSATGMARTSGRVGNDGFRESLENAQFSHPSSGAEFRISRVENGYRMEFSRDDVRAARHLDWFVGSGGVGRSYLSAIDGLLFQAPVSYYSSAQKWDVSPGYEKMRAVELTRVVETGCLQCHATGLQPLAGTQNRFQPIPFREAGIGCERCHGPGGNHIAQMRKGPHSSPRQIVNPAKLDPDRRDSVCAQCHLTGSARVARAGASGYQPGGRLSDSLAIFVWAGAEVQEATATNHFEKFAASRCRQESGARLWCGTCHDPHSQPPAASRIQYYRERCLNCHQNASCKESQPARSRAANDCIACHMPKHSESSPHLAFTDHAIHRRPPSPAASVRQALRSFWTEAPSERDLALAYAIVAPQEPFVRKQAFDLLQRAALRNPRDVPILSQLSQFHDRMGQEQLAMELCERIVTLDDSNTAAAVNLGTYLIKRGRAADAMTAWRKALARNPALTGARINLAVAQFQTGDRSGALQTLRLALEYDPDSTQARRLLADIGRGSQ